MARACVAITFAFLWSTVVARAHARACVGTHNTIASLAHCETLTGEIVFKLEHNLSVQMTTSTLAPMLRVIEGNVTVEGDADTDDTDVPVLFPRLMSVHHLRISRVQRLVGFYAMEKINGSLIVQDCQKLRSAVFGALVEVGGELRVETSGSTSTAQWRFPALRRVGGDAVLTGFQSLDAFYNLGSVGGRLSLRHSNISVWFFGQCGYINITASPAIHNLCFENLQVCDEATYTCARTLLSAMAHMSEVRSFASLARRDELFSRRFQSPSYAATVFVPIDTAWLRRKLRAPSILSAHEARRILAAHVVSSGKYTRLAGNSRLVTDLGVDDALFSAASSSFAHSIIIHGAPSHQLEIGGSPLQRAWCIARRARIWGSCLPAKCDVCGYSVSSADVRNPLTVATNNLEVDEQEPYVHEPDDIYRSMIELDADIDKIYAQEQELLEFDGLDGAVVHRVAATNGVMYVVNGTLFPARIDRYARHKGMADVREAHLGLLLGTPPPSPPPPPPLPRALKPPPPRIASPLPGLWAERPPPPRSIELPQFSSPPARSSCVNICSLCDYTHLPGCCCDEECVVNGDCCYDFSFACERGAS